MKRTVRIWHLMIAGVAGLLACSPVMAQYSSGRTFGTVTDESGKPVAEARLVVVDPAGTTFRLEVKTDRKGNYSYSLADAARTYQVRIEKEGYQPREEKVKVPIGGNTRNDYQIFTLEEAQRRSQAQAVASGELTATDKAVLIFNEGAERAQAQDWPAAMAKFTEALALDPELQAAHSAMATGYLVAKEYAKAVAAAEKALTLNPNDRKAQQVRVEGYRGLGDTAKAAEAAAALAAVDPKAAASQLLEEAAKLYNNGSIKEAMPVLEKAIAAHATLGKAYYLLGMCHVNLGENAKAKAALEKFLELAPDDPDAQTAREMLPYLK